MLTYTLSSLPSVPLYEQLYTLLKRDIVNGVIPAGEKLPSRRAFARNLGVSSITVENAYNRLIDEGYLFSEPKRGFFTADILPPREAPAPAAHPEIRLPQERAEEMLDLSGNRASSSLFPFSVWAHLLRDVINDKGEALLLPSPCGGVPELREAIARHLASFRGMQADPDQIIIGAGTEYLYGLLIQLLGKDKVFCLEDPGYGKIAQIYDSHGAVSRWAPMDDAGISIAGLEAAGADIAHISPTHHFPTGISMPIGRRHELLAWANAAPDRFIVEDDYDSEFRLNGRPLPSLQSIDAGGRVIYMNTFSKSLASTVRISYMVLPPALANRYYEKLSFYSCTVSTFEQYTLARFIADGYFEKHINRMRLHYARLRKQILAVIAASGCASSLSVVERDSGLHFLLKVATNLSDAAFTAALREKNISLVPLSAYYRDPAKAPEHMFLLNYSSISAEDVEMALREIEPLCGKGGMPQ